MSRKPFALRLFLSLALPFGLAACDTGSVDPNDDGGGNGGNGGTNGEDPAPTLVCTANYDITGTFVAANEPNPDIGCDPAGTWTVTLTETENDCADAVPIDDEYVYVIGGDPDGWTYSYNGTDEADLPNTFLKHQASGSECSGSFLHFIEDTNSILNVRPVVIGAALEGVAEFERYSEPQLEEE